MDEVGTFAIWPNEASFNTAHGLAVPSGITVGEPIVHADGRRLCMDNWTVEDKAWLEAHGATVTLLLPTDW